MSDQIFVVTDQNGGNPRQSAWTRKPYAMAEVQAIKNADYDGDASVVGRDVSFTSTFEWEYDGEPDSESLVYGKDWKEADEFVKACEKMEEVRKAREASKRRQGGWH